MRSRWWIALALAGCSTPSAAPAAPAPVAAPVVVVEPTPSDAGDDAPTLAQASPDAFLGAPDAPILDVLGGAEVTRIERGSGGRSLAFRLTFADGSRGYFKPEQTFSGSHFYAEIAAYHLDRALGLGRVPPTIGRRMAWAPLRAAAGGDARVDEAIVRDGQVCGSLSYWVPEPLVALHVGMGWESWARFGQGPLISPFQRARRYVSLASGETPIADADGEVPRAADAPDTADRAAELSDLVLFDYLTENIDRWGGDYTNVRTRGAGGPLVFLDNAAGFIRSPDASPGFMDTRLHTIQRFRRSTVDAIRALSIDALRARIEADACAPILSDALYAQLETRRATLLAHVDRMIAEHGEAALPW